MDQAIASVVVLACAYLGYARTVVPWIEPAARPDDQRPSIAVRNFVTPAARYSDLLTSLFPENSWERSRDAIIMRNDEMLLLLREYETTDDGRLHLNPCTLVYLPTKEAGSRTWKIRAGGGAVLEFDKPFDPQAASVGKLQSGFLPGQVTISSSGDTDGANAAYPAMSERVEIETRGVQLTAERVTAPYDVHFRYGPSFGSGRGLTIDLHAPAGEKETGSSGASGKSGPRPIEVRRMELVSLEEMVFFPPRSGPATLNAAPLLPIRVNSDGPLVIDLEAGLATLEKNVRLERARPEQSPDRLQCNRLTAHLLRVPRTTLTPAGATSRSNARSAMPQIQLERIVAEGLPAVVTSTTGEGADSRWHRFEAERLEYTFDVHNDGGMVGFVNSEASSASGAMSSATVSQAANVGFRAAGTGRYLTGVPSERVTQMELRWRDRMDVDTSKPGFVNIMLVGDTACRIQQLGQIFAQKISVGLRGSMGIGSVGNSNPQSVPTEFGQLRPERIVAEENVQILTDRLDAYTKRLDVIIQSGAQLQAPVAGVRGSNGPLLGAASGGNAGYRDVAVTDRKFKVEGDRLLVNVAEAAGEHQLRDVLLEGHVRCVETSTNPADSPIEMTGNEFRLSDFSESSGLAVIKGAPAVVRARQMAISGSNIHVDRDQNQIWIDGAGAATMPLPRQIADRFPNRPPVADIRWEGGLRFDGQRIECQQRVMVSAHDGIQRVRADRLAADLTQKVDLTASEINVDAVELKSIVAEGNVDLENRTMDDSGWLSIERGLLKRVQLDYQSQTIQGTGPGWIETVRRGSALPQIRPVAVNAGPAKLDGRLTYLRVDFANGFNGSMAKRLLTFGDQVRAVFGPVPNWDSRLDPQGNALQPEISRLSCRNLTVFQVPGREGNPFELSAVGNTWIEGKSLTGQLFSARAHRLSYDPGKDLLMLTGDSRSEAKLYYQRRVGAPRSTLGPARQIQFWPKSNSYELDGVGMLDLNDLGN